MDEKRVILVSACLLGLHTKYNGGHNENSAVLALSGRVAMVPVCPEQLGGLTTPRSAVEICGGDGYDVLAGRAQVLTQNKEDRSEAFRRGALETLRLAKALHADAALLKARSPSCGCGEIYDGSFSGRTTAGDGVAAACLRSGSRPVFTEENLEEFHNWLSAGEG